MRADASFVGSAGRAAQAVRADRVRTGRTPARTGQGEVSDGGAHLSRLVPRERARAQAVSCIGSRIHYKAGMGTSSAPAGGMLVAIAFATIAGCASLEAARDYTAGTRALEAGDTATAITRLERSVALEPGVSESHNHLGLAYLQAGRVEEARRELERALAIDCDNRAARQNLQLLQREGGRP